MFFYYLSIDVPTAEILGDDIGSAKSGVTEPDLALPIFLTSGHHNHATAMSGQHTYRKETNYSERAPRMSPTTEKRGKHHEQEWRRSRSRSPLRKIQEKMEEMKKQPYRKKAREDTRQKFSVVDTFVKFKAKHNTEMSFCGFHWHSWRLAKKGTEFSFHFIKHLICPLFS